MQKLNQWLFCMLFWSQRVEIKVRWTDLLVYKVYLVFLSVISCEEGKALAESWNAAFMESSAKENQVMMRFLSFSVHLSQQMLSDCLMILLRDVNESMASDPADVQYLYDNQSLLLLSVSSRDVLPDSDWRCLWCWFLWGLWREGLSWWTSGVSLENQLYL